jgi:hypothetical protein
MSSTIELDQTGRSALDALRLWITGLPPRSRGLGWGAHAVGGLTLHALMILCTCGLWLPVYWARESRIERTSKFYAA